MQTFGKVLAAAFVGVVGGGSCAAGGDAGAGVVAAGVFLECDDEGFAVLGADAFVAVGDVGVEEDGVAALEVVDLGIVREAKAAVEDIEELRAGMGVGAGLATLGGGEEFGEVGRDAAVEGDVAEAFEIVAGIFDAGLGKTLAFFGAEDAEELGALGLEEVAHVFGEDHRDAREVAEGRDDAAGFELRKEAGAEAGVTA